MTEKVFVDTNILIYAHDKAAKGKYEIAKALIEQLWIEDRGVVSSQVLQEFYVNVTRKIENPLPLRVARELVAGYAGWNLQTIEGDDIIAACQLEENRKLNFWDALIIVAAAKSEATTLVSEDLQHGRTILGVRIENPFRR